MLIFCTHRLFVYNFVLILATLPVDRVGAWECSQAAAKVKNAELRRATLKDTLRYESKSVSYYPVNPEPGMFPDRLVKFPATLLIRVTRLETNGFITEITEPQLKYEVHWKFLEYLAERGIHWKPKAEIAETPDVSDLVLSGQFSDSTVAIKALKGHWVEWTRGGRERLLKHVQNNVDHTVDNYDPHFDTIREPMRGMGKPTYGYSSYSTTWKKHTDGSAPEMVASIRLMTSGKDYRHLFNPGFPDPTKTPGLKWEMGPPSIDYQPLPVEILLGQVLPRPRSFIPHPLMPEQTLQIDGEAIEPGNVWVKKGGDKHERGRYFLEAWKQFVRFSLNPDESLDYNQNGKIHYIWGDQETLERYSDYGFKLVKRDLVLVKDREKIEAQVEVEKQRLIRLGQKPDILEMRNLEEALYKDAKKWLIISAEPADLLRMVEFFERRRDMTKEDVAFLRALLEGIGANSPK